MKKSVILCVVVALCLAVVTGSVAYFTDSITTQNVVASGNLKIEQFELERTADGASLQTYTQNQAIYPSVGTESHLELAAYHYSTADKQTKPVTGTLEAALMADTLHGFVDKIVLVKNNGSLNTYVRTFVAVPTDFDNPEKGIKAIHLDWNKEGSWVVEQTPILDYITVEDQVDNVPYTIYYAINTNMIEPGKSAAPSLLGFYLDSAVGHDGEQYTLGTTKLGSGSELKILVATQAAQAIPTGIGEQTTRAGAVESLNETYDEKDAQGNYTIIHHPWMPAKTNPPTETNP